MLAIHLLFANDDLANTDLETTVVIDVANNDTDDASVDLTSIMIIGFPVGGIQADPNPNGTVTYTPEFGFTGVDTFTYTIKDNFGAVSNIATVSVTVNALNQEPNGAIDTPVGNQTINVGDSIDFTGTGTDPDNNLPLTFDWDFGTGIRNLRFNVGGSRSADV